MADYSVYIHGTGVIFYITKEYRRFHVCHDRLHGRFRGRFHVVSRHSRFHGCDDCIGMFSHIDMRL